MQLSKVSEEEFNPDTSTGVDEENGNDAPPQEGVSEEVPETANNEDAVQASPPKGATCWTDERGNLKVINLMVNWPCLVFWLIIALCIIINFLLFFLVFRTAGDTGPFTVPSNEYELSDVRSIQYDSLRLARDVVQESRKNNASEGKVISEQSDTAAILMWTFEGETPEGVFGSAASIEGMKEAFDIFTDDPGFHDYCLLENPEKNSTELKCTMPITPLVMYYASSWDSEKAATVIEELKDPVKADLFNTLYLCIEQGGPYCESGANNSDVAWATQLAANISSLRGSWDMNGTLVENFTQVTELASSLMQVDSFRGYINYGFDKAFSAENPISQYSRGMISWGGPLGDRNQTSEDEIKEQDESDEEQRKKYIEKNYLTEIKKQAELKTHASINSYYFMTSLIGDEILGILTQDSLLAIISFTFVFIWILVNTRSWFLAFVGLFEIFFAIPVSWFIFSVVFQIKYFSTLNTLAIFIVAAIGADDIFIFMDAYKQSRYHLDILVDLETRMSWVYRRTGSAMAITSATTCAAFLCTLITPLPFLQSFGIFAAIVIFIDYVLVMSLFCTAVVIYHNRYDDRSNGGCCCPCGTQNPNPTENARIALERSEEEIKRDRVSEFFRNKVAKFIQVPLHRLILAVVFLTWLGIAIWQATKIEPSKESEQFLNENNPLQKSLNILNREFPVADEDAGLKVYYAWGLGEVSRKGVNRLFDPEDFGSPNFIAEFDFNKQCQTELLSFCEKLKTDPEYNGLIKRKNGVREVYCFVEEMAAFNANNGVNDCDYVKDGEWKNVTWQVDPEDLPDLMESFLNKNQTSCFDDRGRELISARYSNEIGWDGSSMKYAAIAVESAGLSPFGQDRAPIIRNEYDKFVEIAKEADEVISQYCSGSVIMTDLDQKFINMNNQSVYVQTAIQSAILGVVIAFVVLLLSTRVFHLAFFACLSIGSVLASVIGTMVMIGWSLGSIESILIGILAGFSVDYVVHLAHAYEVAEGDTNARITEAFSDLGISVFNGMITSVGASIPLFFCQLQFFGKFGIFLCLTIVFSWIFANFGFMSLLAQFKIPIKKRCFSF
eukprot:CAMPEP_0194205816 /NCGR_PEP_ID=MMETSP0156-20130528/5020_1 /TAXON_ID=33649 /ORGANISM="Thalassionema nitzschioides, Strain L26-B" /LENGTH=1066 /DNA_ID=CAMNT_0038932197 /DNA_START=76 /DNA_END=3276 /DNA_ORIENTATION=-